MKFKYLISTLLFLCTITVVNAQEDFKTTLQKHLAAISAKDLEGIRATVADSVTLIFPDGAVLKSKKKFVDFHIEWFRDKSWTLVSEVVNTSETKLLSYALIKYRYSSFNADGSARPVSNTFLLLIFQKEKNGWKLIHDQNTKITADH